MSSHGHSSVNDDVTLQVVASTGPSASSISRPPVAPRSDGEERHVHAEEPVLGRDRLDEPDRPPERRRARAHLRDPDGVRAGVDLAEVRLVDARRDLVELDLGGVEVRARDGRQRVVEVARRAVRLDALDVEPRLAADRLERRLDAVGLLARERPADELA